MEYQKRYCNIEKSIQIQNEYRELLKVQHCYDNQWNLLSNTPLFAANPTYKIAYGFVSCAIEGILLRHCFIIDDKNNNVIETTIDVKQKSKPIYYYVISTFNACELLSAILKTELHSPDLYGYAPLAKQMEEFTNWCFEQGMACIE